VLPLLLNTFFNHLDDGIECILSKSADHTDSGEVIDTPEQAARMGKQESRELQQKEKPNPASGNE